MKIPFGSAYAVTPAQLRDGIAAGLVDGYEDSDKSYRSRPGLTQTYTLGSDPVDGLYIDKSGNEISVAGGVVYVNQEACSGETLNSGTLCVFAEDDNYVFIAHGGKVAKLVVSTKTVSFLETASAPDGVSHVAMIQGYLLANGTSGNAGDVFYTGPYTSVTYLDTWEFYNNEALTDGCTAIAEDGQFVYGFGPKSVEISVNDGVTPWARYASNFIQYGIHAPYSLAKADNTFYWLSNADKSLRILKMASGSAKTVSTPFDAVINSLTSTEDAYGFTAAISGHTFYVLQFPGEDFTLVYHIQLDKWYRWAYWDTTEAKYRCFLGRCCGYGASGNRMLIGSRVDGKVGTFTGFTDFGDIRRTELTSGNVKADNYRTKRASRMTFQLERGETTNYTDTPSIKWQHRDDGGKWSPERSVSLGVKGDRTYLGYLDRCGMYIERQHRIVFSEGTCQMVLVEVDERTGLSKP